MTAQVLFFEFFSEKDLHLNAVEDDQEIFKSWIYKVNNFPLYL